MNNGNAASITNNINTARSQSFTYDQLNRVSTAKSQATTGTYAWGLAYTYDPWANLLNASVTQGSAYTLSVAIDPLHPNNRLMGYSYDAAGNMLNDGVNNYTFNAESELVTAAGVTYTYDGDGNRVQKSNGRLYWYGIGSDPLSESDGSGTLTAEYIFLNGARIAMLTLPAGTVNYYVADHLGSSRIVTNASGTILDDSDFMPYGQETSYSAASGNHYKFTGKERDPETGLDDFAARFYSSTMGRFMSADSSKYAHLPDPQTWNLYTYVANNPLNAVDPTGHDAEDGHDPSGAGVPAEPPPCTSGSYAGCPEELAVSLENNDEESQQARNYQLTVNMTYVTYDVSGATADAAMAAANASSASGCANAAGCTLPSYSYTYDAPWSVHGGGQNYSANATATNVKVTADITVSTPSWTGYKDASPSEKKAWDALIGKLMKHEQGHVSIVRAGAELLIGALEGTKARGNGNSQALAVSRAETNLRVDLRSKFDAARAAVNALGYFYDIWTDHGRK